MKVFLAQRFGFAEVDLVQLTVRLTISYPVPLPALFAFLASSKTARRANKMKTMVRVFG